MWARPRQFTQFVLIFCVGFAGVIQALCPATNPLCLGHFSSAAAAAEQHQGPLFPTDNVARSVTGRQLHDLLSSQHGNSSERRGRKSGVVVLFVLAGDPPSVAITPVFKCLPSFFHEEVQFVMVAYSELSLMALMSQGLHALPVLQVNAQGRRYRYSGKHWLAPMLHFVSRALAQEPVVGLDVAHFCSSANQQQLAGADGATCMQRGLQDTVVASRVLQGVQSWGRCDRESSCRRAWECSRWDGEVTLEELRSQRAAPLFYISLVFLALRAIWALRKWQKSAGLAAPRAVQADAQPAVQQAVEAPYAPQ